MDAGYLATDRPYSSAMTLSTVPHPRLSVRQSVPDDHAGTGLAKLLGTFFLERIRSIVICLYFTNSPRSGGACFTERNPHQPIFRPVGTTIPI